MIIDMKNKQDGLMEFEVAMCQFKVALLSLEQKLPEFLSNES